MRSTPATRRGDRAVEVGEPVVGQRDAREVGDLGREVAGRDARADRDVDEQVAPVPAAADPAVGRLVPAVAHQDDEDREACRRGDDPGRCIRPEGAPRCPLRSAAGAASASDGGCCSTTTEANARMTALTMIDSATEAGHPGDDVHEVRRDVDARDDRGADRARDGRSGTTRRMTTQPGTKNRIGQTEDDRQQRQLPREQGDGGDGQDQERPRPAATRRRRSRVGAGTVIGRGFHSGIDDSDRDRADDPPRRPRRVLRGGRAARPTRSCAAGPWSSVVRAARTRGASCRRRATRRAGSGSTRRCRCARPTAAARTRCSCRSTGAATSSPAATSWRSCGATRRWSSRSRSTRRSST